MEILVKIIGSITCILGILLTIYLYKQRNKKDFNKKEVSLFADKISYQGFIKLVVLVAFCILPIGATFFSNYHVFDGSKNVASCNQCHVMNSFVDDMLDKNSTSLAARHYKHGWLGKKHQCYQCHSGYGLNGSLSAKIAGYRHLMKYLTKSYKEPIRIKGNFNNNNCLDCHKTTPKFNKVKLHSSLIKKLKTNQISCVNCHGRPHPKPSMRKMYNEK